MKPKARLAILAGLSLIGVLPSSAITWRSQYYNQTQAENFGRDHPSFQGVGTNGCTGSLIHNARRIITAAHCGPGTSWRVRQHAAVSVVPNSSVTTGWDLRIVKLSANSGGTPRPTDTTVNESGQGFLKAGWGWYGNITSPTNYGWSGTYPLGGTNVFSAGGTTNELNFVLLTNAASIGTGPGDSGSSCFRKRADGNYEVVATTNGAGNGFYREQRVSPYNSWILNNL
ncbi:MAG: S1 family peptidase [Akkermansiaceae bacterium]|nr:S1 family peptidase [Akkermansiaceae bacterium]